MVDKQINWEAVAEKIRKQDKPLYFNAPLQLETKLNPILSPEAGEKLVGMFPMAESNLYPFVSGNTLLAGEEKYCLWLPGCADIFLRNRIALAAEAELNGPEREQWGQAYCGLAPASKERPLVALGQRYRKGSRIPVKICREPTVVGELVIASGGKALLQYGLLSSRMFRVWADALAKAAPVLNLYHYTYKAFPVPQLGEQDRRNIENAASMLAEDQANEDCHSILDGCVEVVFGGPFVSDEVRLQRLAERYLRRKRPSKMENKEGKDIAGLWQAG